MSSSSLESRSQILNIQLLSFVIASQHQNRVDQILSSFSLEPNFLEELLNIASSDDETISCVSFFIFFKQKKKLRKFGFLILFIIISNRKPNCYR